MAGRPAVDSKLAQLGTASQDIGVGERTEAASAGLLRSAAPRFDLSSDIDAADEPARLHVTLRRLCSTGRVEKGR